MKKKNNIALFLLIGVSLAFSCRKETDSYKYDYPYLILTDLSNLSEEGVTAAGEIKNLGSDVITDYGFVWCAKDTPTISNYKLSLTATAQLGTFKGRLNNSITSDVIYNVRPFIQTSKYLVYGNILQFKGLGSLGPRITDFEPREGKRRSQVIITGANFNSNPEVYFGTEKAKVLKAESTNIIVEVPPAIGNVKISVHQNIGIESDQTYNVLYPWTNISLPLELLSIEYPCGFGVNGKVYIFGGHSVATNSYTKHLWEYNPSNNIWILKADFPGEPRRFATSMVINNKAYVGLGDNGTFSAGFSDFWEYDPVIDTWTRKANFPLLKYGNPSGSSVNGKGYIGLGFEQFLPGAGGNSSSKFWSFDPGTNLWLQISDFPYSSVLSAAFTVNNRLFAGTGMGHSDIYELDPVKNLWTNKQTYPGKGQWDVSGFGIGNKAYLGLGDFNNSTINNDFWEFNPVDNSWAPMIDFPFTSKVKAREVWAGFSTNEKGYIFENRFESAGSIRSFWEFDPTKNY